VAINYSHLTLKSYKFKTEESLDDKGISRLQKHTVCHSDGSKHQNTVCEASNFEKHGAVIPHAGICKEALAVLYWMAARRWGRNCHLPTSGFNDPSTK